MEYGSQWLIPKRVILVRTEPNTKVSELGPMQAQAHALANQGVAPVQVILWVVFNRNLLNLQSLRRESNLQTKLSPNTDWIVVTVENPVMRYFASTAFKMFLPRAKVKMVHTIHEALNFIERADSTLTQAELEAARQRIEMAEAGAG